MISVRRRPGDEPKQTAMILKNIQIPQLALSSLVLLAPVSYGASASTKGGMHTPSEASYSDEPRESLGGIATDELPVIERGVVEFGLSGYLDWTDDVAYATNISYGRFVTDNWLLGAKLGLIGRNSELDFSGGLFAEYNFLTGTKWVPFIGLGANWKHVDSDAFESDSIEAVGEFGVKYFIRSNMAISASMSGTWASDTLPNSNDFGSRVNFGLRYFF
jgi:hypothetical protein